jgi:hypothetical protein
LLTCAAGCRCAFPVASPRPQASLQPHTHRQSTAMARASQISSIRLSLSRPIRLISTPADTLSTESRFTAVLRLTGSLPGSRTTSLASPRIVVVHGATRARRSRGIATSRESTTTGRRPISGGSHHHNSPRIGRLGLAALTWLRPLLETISGLPTHRPRRVDARRTRDSYRRSPSLDCEQVGQQALHRTKQHRCAAGWLTELRVGDPGRQLYLLAILTCDKCGMSVPHLANNLRNDRTASRVVRSLTCAVVDLCAGVSVCIPSDVTRPHSITAASQVAVASRYSARGGLDGFGERRGEVTFAFYFDSIEL